MFFLEHLGYICYQYAWFLNLFHKLSHKISCKNTEEFPNSICKQKDCNQSALAFDDVERFPPWWRDTALRPLLDRSWPYIWVIMAVLILCWFDSLSVEWENWQWPITEFELTGLFRAFIEVMETSVCKADTFIFKCNKAVSCVSHKMPL